MRSETNRSRGFVALLSVLIIASLLLLLSEAAGFAAFVSTDAAQDERSYRSAQLDAISCANFALERLDADPKRFAGATTSIQLSDTEWCGIVSASTTGDSASALVFGSSTKSYVPLRISASRASSTAPFRMRVWEEY